MTYLSLSVVSGETPLFALTLGGYLILLNTVFHDIPFTLLVSGETPLFAPTLGGYLILLNIVFNEIPFTLCGLGRDPSVCANIRRIFNFTDHSVS